jgi:hypothetical protein
MNLQLTTSSGLRLWTSIQNFVDVRYRNSVDENVKIKTKGTVFPAQAMKTYRNGGTAPLILTSALNGDEKCLYPPIPTSILETTTI